MTAQAIESGGSCPAQPSQPPESKLLSSGVIYHAIEDRNMILILNCLYIFLVLRFKIFIQVVIFYDLTSGPPPYLLAESLSVI